MPDLLYKEEVYKIQGAIFEVYREKGCGFLESVYQECLAKELAMQGIAYLAQVKLGLSYKGEPLEQSYAPDFICYNKIIIEIKAIKELLPIHRAQVLNYLKATDMRLGLLVNFGHYPKVTIERVIL
jgi:GxxExxY protein